MPDVGGIERAARAVLVTGAAPYLGGPATWAPLRDAARELEFTEVDVLASEGRIDVVRAAIADAVRDADVLVAHGAVAGIALDVLAAERPGVPALLVAPLMALVSSRSASLLRAIIGVVGPLVTAAARAKLRRLRASRSAVVRELQGFVRADRISDALVNEACARIADSRTDRSVGRTADVVRAVLAPLRARAAAVPRVVIAGDDVLGRKLAARMDVRVVHGAESAPMIDAPDAVAAALRDLLRETPATR